MKITSNFGQPVSIKITNNAQKFIEKTQGFEISKYFLKNTTNAFQKEHMPKKATTFKIFTNRQRNELFVSMREKGFLAILKNLFSKNKLKKQIPNEEFEHGIMQQAIVAMQRLFLDNELNKIK